MKSFIICFLLFAALTSCHTPERKDSGEKETSISQKEGVSKNKTYAEISRKNGGAWNGHKYEGGTFENVDYLRVPEQNFDHSFYMRYEGPGWENNKIGYRLYLDWRNGTDIFGKKTGKMVLPQVGQDGFDSYHEPGEWGMDILKVGNSLGIGSIGRLVNDEVIHFQKVDSTTAAISNTESISSVTIDYYGWKTGSDDIDLKSVYSISPDTRYTQHSVTPSEAIEGLCTGIVKHENTEIFKNESKNKKWAYLGTYGTQSLVPDKLGMAIFYETSSVNEVRDSEYDHLIVFRPTDKKISFYFLGAWEQEPNGIKTKEEFHTYLDKLLSTLNDQNTL